MSTIVNPEGLEKPIGYSHAISTPNTGRTIYIAGHVAFDEAGNPMYPGDMVGQFNRALHNTRIAVRAAGAEMTDIVKLNIFVTDKAAYKAHLRDLGPIYREYFGRYFPAMTLVEVKSLFDDSIMIEIEGIAVIDDN